MMQTYREMLSSYCSTNILAAQTPNRLTKKLSLYFADRSCNAKNISIYLNLLACKFFKTQCNIETIVYDTQ